MKMTKRNQSSAVKKQQSKMVAAAKAWRKLSAKERRKKSWISFAKGYLKK
jgi:hypothetical protein